MTNAAFPLRRATAADVPAIWAIRSDAIRRTCRSHYPVEMLEKWASSPIPETFTDNVESDYYVVGIVGSQIAGFAALKVASSEVQAIFVAADMGRRGLGRQLLAHLEETAVTMGLQTLDLCASLNAVQFYRAAGYQAVSECIYTTSAGVEIACMRMQKQICARAGQ